MLTNSPFYASYAVDDLMAAEEYRVVTHDVRGTGESDHPTAPPLARQFAKVDLSNL